MRQNLPVDFESLDDKTVDKLLPTFCHKVRNSDGYMVKDEATKNHQPDDKTLVSGHMFKILGRCFH